MLMVCLLVYKNVISLILSFMYVGQEKPMTTTREWEEATNELFKRDKINPITGIASEGYKGKGYVTHK